MPVTAEIFATVVERVSEPAVRALASDLSDALGANRLQDYDGRGVIYLERESEYHLLPDSLPRTASILRVRLSTSYYGEGYERGYWPEIAATLEFLRRRLRSARIWYGPSGTDDLDELTDQILDKLWDYWATHGGRPYFKRRN